MSINFTERERESSTNLGVLESLVASGEYGFDGLRCSVNLANPFGLAKCSAIVLLPNFDEVVVR
jgi:hypothetical protein